MQEFIMHSSAVCLLVVVAITTASGYGVPSPPRCYSAPLERYFDSGDKWTQPQCQGASCVNGEVKTQECEAPGELAEGCRLEPGTGTEYPDCCSKVCPRPDQCYSAELDRVFNSGDDWTLRGCLRGNCNQGKTTVIGCLLPNHPGWSCTEEKGIEGADYPACCPTLNCTRPDTCYDEKLNKTFNNGDTWTSPDCYAASCRNGQLGLLPCGLLGGGPDCEYVPGEKGAEYPACCWDVKCPKDAPNKYY